MTLLVTSRMSPALAARVANSVAGRRGAVRKSGRAVRLLFRAVTAMLLVASVVIGVGSCRARARDQDTQRRAVDARRDRLRAVVRGNAVGVVDEALVPKVEQLLVRLAASKEGELVSDTVRASLDATLRRPMLFVRGPVASFADPAKIATTAALSAKDSLVLCLLAPPESRAETVILARAKRAYGRLLAIEDATANVRRLHELEVGMPFLVPSFAQRIDTAPDATQLVALERAFDKAPIAEAKRAARAEVLLAAFDEPGDPGGSTEIDGEHAHDVRVVLVDIDSGTTLLRVRRHVDPGWVASTSARIQYASGIDSCALAFDVRAAVGPG